jgi:hypothetical protein
MRTGRLGSVAIALAVTLVAAACGGGRAEVERHLGHGRYARALRTARRIHDPGLRLSSETRIAERLLRRLDGELRVAPEPEEALGDRLGGTPSIFTTGGALSLMLAVDVRASAPASLSFRVVELTHHGRRYLRASHCPPDEAVDLSCADWLGGAPLAPTCAVRDPDRGGWTAVGVLRWVSGGLVNARPPPAPAMVCERPPLDLDAGARAALESQGRRLGVGLAFVPARAAAGRRYARTELLYASGESGAVRSRTATGAGSALRIQMAFHLDRRGAPLRRTAVLPLPEAASPAEALERLFAEPRPLREVFRAAAPPPP